MFSYIPGIFGKNSTMRHRTKAASLPPPPPAPPTNSGRSKSGKGLRAREPRFAARNDRMIRYITSSCCAYDCAAVNCFRDFQKASWTRTGEEDGAKRDRERRGGRTRINQSGVLPTQPSNPHTENTPNAPLGLSHAPCQLKPPSTPSHRLDTAGSGG